MNTPLPCSDGAFLKAILRGSVSPEQELEIAGHLDECVQCRAVVEMLCIDDGPITEPSSDTGPETFGDRKSSDPVESAPTSDSKQSDAQA
jgi:hypothetical protein